MSEEVITAAITKGGARAESIAGARFAAQLSIDGYPFVIDAGEEDGGDGLGPNPTRTLEGALAACAVITMRMYAERKKWPLRSVAVTVKRAPGEDGHVVKNLIKEYEIEGDLDEAQRARIKEIGDRCPVHRMLTEGVQIESRQA